jgi:hypothetical protein
MPRGPAVGDAGLLTRAFEDDSSRLKQLLDDVTRQLSVTPVSA